MILVYNYKINEVGKPQPTTRSR